MANTRSGNTWSVDTTSGAGGSDLAVKAVSLTGVLLNNAGGSVGHVQLTDPSTGAVKFEYRAPASDSRYVDLARGPILCPNGLRVAALDASCTAIAIFSTAGG